MKSKLTLTVEADVITSAKQLARRKGTSVSSLFEQWAIRMSSHEEKGSAMEALTGLWGEDSVRNEELEKLRLDALLEKYGS